MKGGTGPAVTIDKAGKTEECEAVSEKGGFKIQGVETFARTN